MGCELGGLPASGWGLELEDAEGGRCMGTALKLAWGVKGLHCSKGAAGLRLTGPRLGLPLCPSQPGWPCPGLAAHRPLLLGLQRWRGAWSHSGVLSMQVLGLVRVPLYTQKDRVGGFPNFLSNAFTSTAKYQLLFALKVLNMMPEEKLAEALAAATEKQKKALEKLLPSSS